MTPGRLSGNKCLSPEKVQRIKEMWLAGEKTIVIALELQVKGDTITKYRRLLGLPNRQEHPLQRKRRAKNVVKALSQPRKSTGRFLQRSAQDTSSAGS